MCSTPTQYSFSIVMDRNENSWLKLKIVGHTGLKIQTENPLLELAFVLNALQYRDDYDYEHYYDVRKKQDRIILILSNFLLPKEWYLVTEASLPCHMRDYSSSGELHEMLHYIASQQANIIYYC